MNAGNRKKGGQWAVASMDRTDGKKLDLILNKIDLEIQLVSRVHRVTYVYTYLLAKTFI